MVELVNRKNFTEYRCNKERKIGKFELKYCGGDKRSPCSFQDVQLISWIFLNKDVLARKEYYDYDPIVQQQLNKAGVICSRHRRILE